MKTNLLLGLLLGSAILVGCGEGDGQDARELGASDQAQLGDHGARSSAAEAARERGRPAQCPDVCAAVCAGRPEPAIPPGCPIPDCECPNPPECPDVCAAVCAGRPEPTIPRGCPISDCGACPGTQPPSCSDPDRPRL